MSNSINRVSVKTLDIYQNQGKIKWVIIGFGFIIGVFSLFYSNWLSKQITAQETVSINLFAHTQEFIASPESDNNFNFLVTEILNANKSIPVILADEDKNPIYHENINLPKALPEIAKNKILRQRLESMEQAHAPIVVPLGEGLEQYIYYDDSDLARQVRFYPMIQLLVIGFIGALAYITFTTSKRSEQNRVWAGLAKETAHQLGTPISSLIAWVEYFRTDPNFDESIIVEIEKDIQRLQTITDRFSNIGSIPNFQLEDVPNAIEKIVGYLQKRVSTKVQINVTPKFGQKMVAKLNSPLFEWVIENICKNAVDAMQGVGRIDIYIRNIKGDSMVQIDICDTGKGIPKSKLKTVFQPGYTTKKRGWGLGLTLVKRIIEHYHNGKIFVKRSDPEHGTTFRILLPK